MEEKEPVRVLTKDEKNSYEGVTIDEDGGEASYSPYQQKEAPRYYRVYSSHSPFSRGLSYSSLLFGNDWRTRLVRICALVGVGFLLVVFVSFILPVLLGVAGIALASWLILRFLNRI
jgi:hypothetical protein